MTIPYRSIFTKAMLVGCLLHTSLAVSNDLTSPLTAIAILHPQLPIRRAIALSKSIELVSRDPQCRIPWQVLVSVAFNESTFKINAVNATSKDYGLMQINERMIVALKLNKDKLLTDSTYALAAGCQILSLAHRTYSKKYTYWLGTYRSGTALWKEKTRQNAISYDKIIRQTAEEIGYHEPESRKTN